MATHSDRFSVTLSVRKRTLIIVLSAMAILAAAWLIHYFFFDWLGFIGGTSDNPVISDERLEQITQAFEEEGIRYYVRDDHEVIFIIDKDKFRVQKILHERGLYA